MVWLSSSVSAAYLARNKSNWLSLLQSALYVFVKDYKIGGNKAFRLEKWYRFFSQLEMTKQVDDQCKFRLHLFRRLSSVFQSAVLSVYCNFWKTWGSVGHLTGNSQMLEHTWKLTLYIHIYIVIVACEMILIILKFRSPSLTLQRNM